MLSLNAFQAKVLSHFTKYFDRVKEQTDSGDKLVTETGAVELPRYPTTLLIYELEGVFAAELVGSASAFAGLRVLHARTRKLSQFLGNFGDSVEASSNTVVKVGNRENVLTRLSLLSEPGQAYFNSRYPELRELTRAGLSRAAGDSPADGSNALYIDGERLKDLALIHVLTVSTLGCAVRARFFQAAFLFGASVSSSYVAKRLAAVAPLGSTDLMIGTNASDSELLLAANFASLANVNQIYEPNITSFLEDNPSVLAEALGGFDIRGQVEVLWLVKRPDGVEEKAVKPDFLFEGIDGKWHICEFKLPLLDVNDLTVSTGSRRRLSTRASEGVEQLYHYDEFFTHSAHREYLNDEYGIKIADQPRLVLVIGSVENCDHEHVRQATRSREHRLELLDYDTLRSLYILASKIKNRSNLGQRKIQLSS